MKLSIEKLSINTLKFRVSQKFPNSEIANILLNEPDKMSVEEFIAKGGTWLAILDSERNNNLKLQMKRKVRY
jgi:hypothetical protein